MSRKSGGHTAMKGGNTGKRVIPPGWGTICDGVNNVTSINVPSITLNYDS